MNYSTPTPADPMSMILTTRDTGERCAPQRSLLSPGARPGHHAEITLGDPSGQSLLGFGGAFTEAAASTLAKLTPEQREDVLRAYFDPESGSGYTLCRTHINSCDFSLDNYAYNEVDGDFALEHFDISRDRKFLIPMIRDAQRIAGRPLRLVASPWSPPAWMKTNGQMNHGGKLRPECRKAWARYFARYIQAYAEEGIAIWAVTVQNEPQAVQTWDSCIYSHEEQRDFVRDFLGPTLQEEGLEQVKILIWDHNRDEMMDCANIILSDPAAAQYVWGVAFHWYSGDDSKEVGRVREAFPDQHLLFTEGCQEGGVKLGSWDLGEKYAHAMIEDLRHGAGAWIDWNMVLDAQGGPNHVGNYCDAPVIVDTERGTVHYQNAYDYIRHFSRAFKPDGQILETHSDHPGLEVVGCQNADGTRVIVVLNRTEEAIAFHLRDASGHTESDLPAHSIASYTIQG